MVYEKKEGFILKKILTIEDLNPIFEKAIGPTKNNLIAFRKPYIINGMVK